MLSFRTIGDIHGLYMNDVYCWTLFYYCSKALLPGNAHSSKMFCVLRREFNDSYFIFFQYRFEYFYRLHHNCNFTRQYRNNTYGVHDLRLSNLVGWNFRGFIVTQLIIKKKKTKYNIISNVFDGNAPGTNA